MNANLNRVTLMGRVGGDVEFRLSERSGKPLARFALVTIERWTDRDTGMRVERPEIHKIVVLNDVLAHFAQRKLHRGALVFLEGAIATRIYDSHGEPRSITEVVLGPYKSTLHLLGSSRSETSEEAPLRSGAMQDLREAMESDPEPAEAGLQS